MKIIVCFPQLVVWLILSTRETVWGIESSNTCYFVSKEGGSVVQGVMLDYNSPISILQWLLDTLEDKKKIRRFHLLREMHGLWKDANQLQYQSLRSE